MSTRQGSPPRGNGDLIRVIMDTSVLMRYLIRPGAALRELIEVLWLGEQIQMVTCPELLAELEDVLKRDYIQVLVQPEEADALLDAIRRRAEFLPSLGVIPTYTRDRKDDKFIACAIAGHVKYIITADKDLLDITVLAGIHLLTPHKLLELFPTLG